MKRNSPHHHSIKSSISKSIFSLCLCILIFSACTKETEFEEFIIPTRVSFANANIIVAKDAVQAVPIAITLARPLEKDGKIVVQLVAASTTAAATEFTTSIPFVANAVTIDLPKGTSTASFSITSLHNFDENKVVTFKIISVAGGAVLNETNTTTTVTLRGNTWIDPAMTSSLTTLTSFGNVNVGTESTSKSYTLTGANLSTAVTVTASDNFKVSTNNTTFASSVTVAANNTTATIYVKFAPNSKKNQDLTGTITHSFTGLANVVVNVSGTEAGNIVYVPEVPLVNENFDYGATTDFITRIAPNWTAYSAAGAIPVTYIPQGLTFAGYGGSGVGGSVTIQHGDFSREDIALPFTPKTTGVIYMSVLINLKEAGTGDFFYATRDGAGSFFNRLYAKDAGNGVLNLGLGKNATVVYSTANYKYNTTYLVVIKYDFTAKISTMYVMDAALPDVEPTTPAAVSVATGTSPTTLNDFSIRQSDGILTGTLDGIKLTATWKGALGL